MASLVFWSLLFAVPASLQVQDGFQPVKKNFHFNKIRETTLYLKLDHPSTIYMVLGYQVPQKSGAGENTKNECGFCDYDLGYLKYLIAFMESTFTAPEGMYVKCDENGGFVNDRIWSNQAVFRKKIKIFDGAKSFILDMLYEILSVKGLKLNNKLPDFIFMLIESPKMVIEDNIRKIFYLDNQLLLYF